MAMVGERIETAAPSITTVVAALYLHGPRRTMLDDTEPTPMIAVDEVEAIAGVGLRGAARHMKTARRGGKESKRQVSLIDEGTIGAHRQVFGPFPVEFVKSQIVLAGAHFLPEYLGRELLFGDEEGGVILALAIKRYPCEAMDLISPGLREAMADGRQGVLARVVRGGTIRRGQRVSLRPVPAEE